MSDRKKIIFLCIGNSCRSQMAEGILKSLKSDEFEVYSAGSMSVGVHPLAKEVMSEIGIDISDQYSKSIDEFKTVNFDYVVTLCGEATEICPLLTGKNILHWDIEDPVGSGLQKEEKLALFRKVRNEIMELIKDNFC